MFVFKFHHCFHQFARFSYLAFRCVIVLVLIVILRCSCKFMSEILLIHRCTFSSLSFGDLNGFYHGN